MKTREQLEATGNKILNSVRTELYLSVLVLVELIVDVLKLDGFRVVAVRHAANAVGEHPLKRDAVLCGLAFLILPLRSCDGGLDLPAFGAGEFCAGGQCDTPPGLNCPAVPERRRNYWLRKGAAWGAGSRPARCCGRSFQGAVRSSHTWPAEKRAA